MHVHLLLEMAAEAAPDRIAFGPLDGGLTLAELLRASRQAAAGFVAQAPCNITYTGLNGPALPVALFGASMAGSSFSPLNYRLADADLRKLVARSAPSVGICDDEVMPRVADVEGARSGTVADFLQHCRGMTDEPTLPEPENDVAVVLFTSGTTSEPKAAILRHANLTSYVLSTIEFLGADESEATLVSVPPYHIAGISAVLTSIYSGRRVVQLASFTPEAWVDAALAENITHAMVVPTMLGRILDVLERRGVRLPTLRALSYGGGRMPTAVIERAMDLLPQVDFVNAYGLTETSSTIAILDPESHRAARAATSDEGRRRLSSVGRPLPTLELEVRDEDEQPVPAGTVGEIWVRGDQVSGEYAGKKAIRDDGWFPTNDAGWLDTEGYLFVEGRLDDVIVRGGENISPSEIEDVLRLHPAIEDAAVVGVADEEWGEKIVAAVVAKPGTSEAELKALVKERLRSSRVPASVIFVSGLPYNETGKLLRRVLRTELAEALQLNAERSVA